MLGHRGCRLGITYPEIYEMQARAILEAALDVEEKGGAAVQLEIMIPLVAFKSEIDVLAARIAAVAAAIKKERGKVPDYLIGTMIELPRAALMAGEIAKTAQFFSFGTNDLTQTTIGISRDDAGMFLNDYLAKGVIARDPFVSLDTQGVGELIRIAAERGRKTRENLKLGICGEHGGDPRFHSFLSRLGAGLCLPAPHSACRLHAWRRHSRSSTRRGRTYNQRTDYAAKHWIFQCLMTHCHVNEKNCLTIRFWAGKHPLSKRVLGTISEIFEGRRGIETA